MSLLFYPDKIFIGKGRIPIQLIGMPCCEKCMNEVAAGESLCNFCKESPPIGDDWFFNKVVCMGTYEHDDSGGKSNPRNILSRLVLMFKYGYSEQQNFAKNLLGEGLHQITALFPFLIEGVQYMVASPKFNERNRSFGDVLIDQLSKLNHSLLGKNITSRVHRLKDVGDVKHEKRDARFEKMMDVHRVDIPDLEGKKILIMDDVFTSGATAWDLSRALKEKNAGEINVLALARASNFTNIDYDFNELLMFFTGFDSINRIKEIMKVPIEKLSISDTTINCVAKGTTQMYDIKIDMVNKTIFHGCADFQKRRANNKEFCKHIASMFFVLNQTREKELATRVLDAIYRDLPEWIFQSI